MFHGLSLKRVRDFWKQRFCKSRKSSTKRDHIASHPNDIQLLSHPNDRLPADIMIDILSRLPVDSVLACKLVCHQWHHLTSSYHFSEVHLQRATPTMLATFTCNFREKGLLVEDFGKVVTLFERLTCRFGDKMVPNDSPGTVVSSCHGLLIYCRGVSITSMNYAIYNPFIREKVILGDLKLYFVCFFFDELTKEYMLLLYDMHTNYFVYGLRTNKRRQVYASNSRFVPKHNSAVSLPRALFWMVTFNFNNWHKNVSTTVDLCSECIMMFNLDNEEIRVMPHPGRRCSSYSTSAAGVSQVARHQYDNMRLLEMDRNLLFSVVHRRSVDIWGLENLVNLSWAKRYVVNLSGELNNAPYYDYFYCKVLNIIDGQLLIHWVHRGLFWCDLRFHVLRRDAIGSQIFQEMTDNLINLITYTKSFVSPKQILL